MDGNTNGALWDGYASATNYNTNAWWQVDLGSVQSIGAIQVWGRSDCCQEMTTNYYVFVSDNPFTSTDLNTTLNQPGVSNYYVPGYSGTPGTVNANRTGRYVRVQFAASQYLVLGEVKVLRSTADVNWLVTDQLGTPRMIFDKTGSFASVKRHDYLPFGEEISAYGGRTTGQGYVPDNIRQQFTLQERDMETGLDYMKARYYSGTMGRFTSVDPSRKSIIPTNPQTWNRYSYTYNNPLRYVDKNGKWPTETHNTIIRNAFDRLAKQQPDKVRQIQKGSESVDANWRKPVRLVLENTLVESMAPRHAMTPGFKVRELGSESAAREWARGEATKFINEKMGEATAMQNANHNQSTVSNAALNLFGQGAHPIMDGASPAHREFQVYDLAPYQTLAAVNTLVAAALYARDMDAHTETESKHPTQDEMNQMVDDLRMQYLNAFGREMYEQAVSPEERAATDRRRNPQR